MVKYTYSLLALRSRKKGVGGKQISPRKMPLKISRENFGKSLIKKLAIILEKFREMFRHLFRKSFRKVPRFILEKVWEFFYVCFQKCLEKVPAIILDFFEKASRKDSRKGEKKNRSKIFEVKKIVIKI